MNWEEIIKQPRRPSRPISDEGARDRVRDPELVFKPKTRTAVEQKPKSRHGARNIVKPKTETQTETAYEDECQCETPECMRKAEYKCRKCSKRFCVFHFRTAEVKDEGQAEHTHGFAPWDCKTDTFYNSVKELREEAGNP